MPPSLGVNLRVTGHCNQGGRKYMEGICLKYILPICIGLLNTLIHLHCRRLFNCFLILTTVYFEIHVISDVFSVAYQQTNDEKDLEYAFFGIFDGHGGREAAQFAKVGPQKPTRVYSIRI